jgi:hypothetical protein
MRALIMLGAAAIASAITGDDPRASALVTVANGLHAGSYTLEADAPCEIQQENPPKPRHQFNIVLSQPQTDSKHRADPKVPTFMLLIIPDADVRGANRQFFSSVNFGDESHGTQYNVESRPGEKKPEGSGTVTLVQHGHDATVKIDAKTAEGITYTGTIQCTNVSRY